MNTHTQIRGQLSKCKIKILIYSPWKRSVRHPVDIPRPAYLSRLSITNVQSYSDVTVITVFDCSINVIKYLKRDV